MQQVKFFLMFVLLSIMLIKPSIATVGNASAGFLNTEELKAIDEALANLKMDRSDLLFKRDYVDDDYRMKVCQMVLDDPMLAPDYADLLYRFIHAHGERFGTVLVKAYQDMGYLEEKDIDEIFDSPSGVEDTQEISGGLHPFLIEILNEYIRDMTLVRRELEAAFKPLSKEDAEFIRLELPDILLENISEDEDEEEKVDTEKLYDKTEKFLDLWLDMDLASLGKASVHFGNITDRFVRDYWLKIVVDPEKYKDVFSERREIETSLGRIITGTFDRDVYTEEVFLILDPGGDDFYTFSEFNDELAIKAIVDCLGDDYYHSTADAAFGSGYFGIGCLLDFAGNDVYSAQNFSIGSGVFGTGVLADFMGNDLYSADTCGQGSGAFGFGYLHDADGDDHYTGAFQLQGFAFTGGMGILSDSRGDDSYWAGGKYPDDPRYPDRYLSLSQGFSIGIRPIASGGVGVLFDHEGSDNYWTDIYGQGVSYWYSLGILVDGDGHDWYESHQYNQGSGIHLSTGVLIDHAGNDRYSGGGLSQGNAHDYAVGWLIDRAGNDSYVSTGLSLGAGNANAVGIFIDDMGNDSYYPHNGNNSLGWAGLLREFGGIGIFIDLAGKDFYSVEYEDGDSWVKDFWGAGIDRIDPVEE